MRDHIECYSTSFPSKGSIQETARACIEAGFKAFRTAVADSGRGLAFDARLAVRRTVENCRQIREAIGKDGEWAIDYHTRLDMPGAIRLSRLIEDLDPIFAEDSVRSENPGAYRTLRPRVKVPIAVGEQCCTRWDLKDLATSKNSTAA